MLRDDVLSLLADIRSNKKEILHIMNDLLRWEEENRLHMKSGNTDALEESLGEAGRAMEGIDALRARISALHLRLSAVSGLDETGILSLMATGKDPVLVEIRDIDEETERLAKSLNEQRDLLISSMESLSLSIGKEIRELHDLERLLPRMRLPGEKKF